MVYLTCAVIGLGGRGVIKTWTEVAARVRLYMLMSDLTSLVPLQFSHWLQVGKVCTVYLFIYFYGKKILKKSLESRLRKILNVRSIPETTTFSKIQLSGLLSMLLSDWLSYY